MQPVDRGLQAVSQFYCGYVIQSASEHHMGSKIPSLVNTSAESTPPRFIFTPTASITCLISPRQLQCRFINGQSVSWIPHCPLPIVSAEKWGIEDAIFYDNETLVVLLTLYGNSRTMPRCPSCLICVLRFDDNNNIKFVRVIGIKGIKATRVHIVPHNEKTPQPIRSTFSGIAALAFDHGAIALLGKIIPISQLISP